MFGEPLSLSEKSLISLSFIAAALALAWPLSWPQPAHSAERIACTVILDEASGKPLHRQGACDQRFYPQSTFKLPLAVMGYDAGILIDAHAPLWKYQEAFNAPKRARKDIDPEAWERESIVWYSQELTRKLGRAAFDDYIKRFGYGNRDTSGTPGRNDGLTQSWLMSSLKISADEQVAFIRRLRMGDLPVSADAHARAGEIIPRFTTADGWQVQGKTGSGWLRDKAGRSDPNRPLGWFVGWASKGERRVVFARLLVDTKPYRDEPISFVVRDSLIADLPALAR